MLAKDAPYKEQFIRALNDMDIDITDYRYDKDSHLLFRLFFSRFTKDVW